jgi:hypothetical protein
LGSCAWVAFCCGVVFSSAIDGLLAATALQHNLTIVSRNVIDFENTPAPILNPWEA